MVRCYPALPERRVEIEDLRLEVKRLREAAKVPSYATLGAAGLDLYACLEAPMEILPATISRVSAGVAVAIPEGYVGLVVAPVWRSPGSTRCTASSTATIVAKS